MCIATCRVAIVRETETEEARKKEPPLVTSMHPKQL